MGCCYSEPVDPAMERFTRAGSYKLKAQIILEIGGRQEKARRFVSAIGSYSTYIRCMAVHCFKEADRKKKDDMINMGQHCRTIYRHRLSLRNRAVQEANSACCGPSFVFTEPSAPPMLAPYEWSAWLEMCRGTGDVEAALKKMGLIRIESKETVAMRLAEASKSTVNVALNNNVSNQNSVSPTINVAGPTTNVAGPNTSTNIAANPNMNNSPSMVNAQTGEGNVAPHSAVGGGHMMPMLGHAPSGAFSGAGSLGSAELAAAMAAQQMQMAQLVQQQQAMLAAQQQQMMAMAAQQQQMAVAGSGVMPQLSPMYYQGAGGMGMAMPQATMPMTPMMAMPGSGGVAVPPTPGLMPEGYPATGVPVPKVV